MSAVTLPQTALGSLQHFPRPPSWFQGGRFAAGGEWRGVEGRKGLTEKGKGRNEEGMRKGGSWGNSALVVGDRRPCPFNF